MHASSGAVFRPGLVQVQKGPGGRYGFLFLSLFLRIRKSKCYHLSARPTSTGRENPIQRMPSNWNYCRKRPICIWQRGPQPLFANGRSRTRSLHGGGERCDGGGERSWTLLGSRRFRSCCVTILRQKPRTRFVKKLFVSYKMRTRFVRRITQTTAEYPSRLALFRREADSKMQTGGGLPEVPASVLSLQNASPPRSEESLVLASVRGYLGIPAVGRQMRRLYGSCMVLLDRMFWWRRMWAKIRRR